jgi:hypothetical protein
VSTAVPDLRYGSDLIVALLQEAGIEHVAFNPGASFRGLHDSLVHTPGAPQLTLCLHEMVAVSMAQGYAKAAGKPMAALLHNVVGLQNAAMAIYNAWCDRAPMLLLGGTGPKSKNRRRPWIDWIHTASVQGNLVRDFVTWDDEPHDVYSVEESFARGLSAASSSPQGPVYLCYDVDLQEDPLPADLVRQGIGRYAVPSPPAPTRRTSPGSWSGSALQPARWSSPATWGRPRSPSMRWSSWQRRSAPPSSTPGCGTPSRRPTRWPRCTSRGCSTRPTSCSRSTSRICTPTCVPAGAMPRRCC